MERFKRVFVVVMDSLGVGAMPDSADFGDIGVNTLGHISESVDTFKIPNLQKLGMANIIPLKQVPANEHPIGYYGKLRETSRGKDTMTGHWEMMGIKTEKPFKTFTETGFPPELIAELEKRCGKRVIGILDEINMAKNDAVSVLHATLDHRRRIDIPGYNRILLHPATRFIGTMNYGYAGTRELNEALVSRFMVIDMPEMDEDSVLFVLRQHFPDGEKSALKAFAGLFLDLQIKAYHGEISTKSLDLRGLVSAVKATRSGLSPIDAIQMGIINKSFDVFEKEIVEDVVSTRIPSSWTGKDIWG